MSPAGNATLGDYAWAEDLMALTVTFLLHTGTIEDVFRATGMAWTPTRPTRFMATDFDPQREPLLVDRLGEWLVLLAPNGFQFSLPDIAAAVSRVGRVVSVYWNVNAVMRVLVADAGRITHRSTL
jgi:hypothetical protein